MGKRFRQLTQTATDADLVEGNYFGVDTLNVTKKVPANLLAKQSALETTNGNVTTLTTYAQNVVHSIAPEFDPTRDSEHAYKAGESVTYTDGKVYTFTAPHYGAWTGTDVRSGNAVDITSFDVKQISETTKNLAEIQPKEPTTSSGLTYSFGSKNCIKISGTTTSTSNNDVSIYLRKEITLPAGKYTISISGRFEKGNTTTCYLMYGGSSAGYSSFSNDGVCTITVSNEATIERILIRFNNIQAVSVDGYLQLEAGGAATSFENSTTAIDYKARNDINLFKETTNLVNPIFINGDMSSGAVDLSNTSSCKQWIVTEKIYHINKGSRIDYIGNDSIYFVVAKFVGGSFDSNVLSASFNGSFYFNEDMDVRFAMRKADYSNITPNLASNNLKFSLCAKDSQASDLNIIFYGLGSGENFASGQATLFKLPNGKNLLVDSNLESYHNAMANALQAAGVRRIDYYVQTHYHGDHTGILKILELAPTRIDITGSTFFLPPTITLENIAQVTDNAQTLVDRQTAMENYCTANDCTVVRPDSLTYYDLGGGVKIKFYNTDHTDYSTHGSGYYSTNYNDWSICPEIFYGLKVVNVSADIGPIAQRKVAGTCFKADILTAPHHGWDNGVNNLIPAYINNVCPDVVISQNGKEHLPDNDASQASVMKASSPMQSYCEANGVPNYMTCLNGPTKVIMSEQSWKFDGTYSRYIRNGKNWSYTDNSEHIEN